MEILLQPTYFPSISHCVAIAKATSVEFEVDDNFQKQTNRNRMYIYSPNGLQMLNVPTKHYKNIHQKTRDIKIENDFSWQKLHFKSLESAYRSSPFFEYFEDELLPIFEKKHIFLLDLNFETIDLTLKFLRLTIDYKKTTEYFHEPTQIDYRNLSNGKKDTSKFESYSQVFADKFGFLNNLSCLDLIFNDGRFAADYLKNQELP